MNIPEYIYSEGLKLGCTKEALCALLAQIQKESLFNPQNLEDTANKKLGMSDQEYTRAVDNGTYGNFVLDGFGYGLPQLTFYSRKRQYLNFSMSRKKSIGDAECQVEYIYWELKNNFNGIWQMMLSSHDLYELTKELLYKWENPQEKENNLKERYGYAQEWMKKVDSFGKGVKTGMTKQEAINKVLNLAREEIGYHEKASNSQLNDKTANSGGANWNKYAEYLDSYAGFYNGPKNGYAWCDIFCDFLFVYCFGIQVGREMLCQPMNSAGAGCLYSAQYYKSAGQWVTNSPQPGDQIFFTYSAGEYSHTGIVEQVNGDTVTTIEGNTSDMVGRRNYNIGNPVIAGYGRPRWELASKVGSTTPTVPSQTTPAQSQPVETLIRKGAKGAKVKELQENLMKLGYDLGKWGADGDFGNDTFEAVKKFQEDHNLEVDGIVGKNTREAIEKALKETANKKEVVKEKVHEFKKGEVVNFVGNKFYKSSKNDKSVNAKGGKAKITYIYKGKGVQHPYYVIIKSGGRTQFGWVDESDIEAL